MEADPYEKTGKTDRPFTHRCTAAGAHRLWGCAACEGAAGETADPHRINQYRTSNGAKAVDEIPELSKAEQFWVDAFRKEGDYKVLLIKTDLVYDDYDKMIPAEWEDGPCFGWYNISQDGQEYNLLETTDPSDTAALMQLFAEESDFNDVRYTAVGIGVATINGKICWACTLYEPNT